jgi:hypothetical protein
LSVPSVADVRRIAASENPVVRNLEITQCYSRLAAAVAARVGTGASWCTYATWASRQAGATIRGEDMQAGLARRLGHARWVLHPVVTLWRRLLRRGLLQPETRLGRLTAALHTPFDAFERASDAVARGNLKVFAEIGLEFARWLEGGSLDELRPGDPPEGQRYLRQAFTRYTQLAGERDPDRRLQLAVLANLEIGLHEQTRLEPEIREALDAGTATEEDLGRRALVALVPGAAGWWALFRRPTEAVLGGLAKALQRASSRLARELVTESLMVLSLPGRVLALGADLADPVPAALRHPSDADLAELLARFAADDCGARDWSALDDRMRYIARLFCAFQLDERLAGPPFTPEQVAAFERGEIPSGGL